MRRKSRELRVPSPQPTAPTGDEDEVKEVLELIKRDRDDPTAMKKRRNSKESMKESQMNVTSTPTGGKGSLTPSNAPSNTPSQTPDRLRSKWTDKDEAAAINNLIKEAKASGGEAIKERRRSKEGLDLASHPSKPSKTAAGATSYRSSSRTSQPNAEVAEINRKIAEDRRLRREMKEREDAEKAARKHVEDMQAEIYRAEIDAEKAELEQKAHVADAVARGSAKAAAAKAGGVFHTKAEWERFNSDHKAEVAELQRKIETLKLMLISSAAENLKDDGQKGSTRKKRSSFINQMSDSFKRMNGSNHGGNLYRQLARSASTPFRRPPATPVLVPNL